MSPHGEPEACQGKVNQYHILKNIGTGAFGRVSLCRSGTNSRYYACKIISKSRLRRKFRWSANGSQDHLKIVKREIAILKKLSLHPNINALVEVLDDAKEDLLYMIFELCEYGAVMQLRPGERVRPFSEALSRRYFIDILRGLEFLHFKGIIHRDIKPENLFLTVDGSVQIGDFGISHLHDSNESLLGATGNNATPAFSPPEYFACAEEEEAITPAFDLWSLGVTLFCFLHGHCPYENDNIMELHRQILTDEPQISESISPEAHDLMMGLMCKDLHTRLTLNQTKMHAWVTQGGTEPLWNAEENYLAESDNEPTEAEVEAAMSPALMFVTKIFNRFKGKRRSATPIPAPARDDLTASSAYGGVSRSAATVACPSPRFGTSPLTTFERPVSVVTTAPAPTMTVIAPSIPASAAEAGASDGLAALLLDLPITYSPLSIARPETPATPSDVVPGVEANVRRLEILSARPDEAHASPEQRTASVMPFRFLRSRRSLESAPASTHPDPVIAIPSRPDTPDSVASPASATWTVPAPVPLPVPLLAPQPLTVAVPAFSSLSLAASIDESGGSQVDSSTQSTGPIAIDALTEYDGGTRPGEASGASDGGSGIVSDDGSDGLPPTVGSASDMSPLVTHRSTHPIDEEEFTG